MNTDPEILCQPQLLKPLHGLNPRTIKGDLWWNSNRQAAYFNAGYKCEACGVHKSQALFHNWLEAHESYRIDFDNHCYHLDRLIALCHACHNFIHSGRLGILREKGKITKDKYEMIIIHGEAVLIDAQLNKRQHILDLTGGDLTKLFPESNGTWSKWHLLFEGQKYYSKFKSFSHWKSHYNH